MSKKKNPQLYNLKRTDKGFLMRMYDQMFVTVNSIHNNIWNMIIIIGGGIGIWQLYSKCCNDPAFDVVVFGYIITLSWTLTKLVNFNYLYNRNLFIVRNIEDLLVAHTEKKKIFRHFRHTNTCGYIYKKTLLIEMLFVGLVLIGTVCCYICVRNSAICKFFHAISPYLCWATLIALPFLPALTIHYLRRKDYYKKTHK